MTARPPGSARLFRAACLAHATTPAFVRRVAEASAVIAAMRAAGRRPYVAVSGGKDSAVALHLVRAQVPEAPAVHSDDEWLLPETEAYLATIPGLVRLARRRQHADWFTAWAAGRPAVLPPGTEWIERLEHDSAMGTWARAHGCDTAVIGLRAEEAGHRRVHLAQGPLCRWVAARGMWHAYPLAWWRTRDVWAYLLSRGVPYNAAYDRMRALGWAERDQRIGPFAVEAVVAQGQLARLREGWPAVFAAFAARYPEARGYA